jgi:nicotinamide-nucleotide amidase
LTARAGIVVTGTEVLTGRVRDRNGPWLAERLMELGVELAHVTICGDRPEDIEAQLRFMADQGVDLIVTSGGLGPTADDMTIEVVAGFAGRRLHLDEQLEAEIAEILKPLLARFPHLETEAFRRAVAARTEYAQHTLRLFGIPESEIAETLRVAEGRIEGFEQLEITTCLRRGEVEVVVMHEPASAAAWEALLDLVAARHEGVLFSADGSTIDEQVAKLLAGRRVATAESSTGGLMAARLIERPGASEYVAGGVVAYADEAKTDLLGVDPALIERHGAVSPEVAGAMADGALERLEADTAVAITGVAGPGGGTEAKPVGYVCWCVKLADGAILARDVRLPGDRAEIRDRSTTVGMHLLRRLLRGEKSPI